MNVQNELCGADGVDEIHSWPFAATEGTQFQSSQKGRTENKRLTESRLGLVPLQGSKRLKIEYDPTLTAFGSER